jgi:hypothetical protein
MEFRNYLGYKVYENGNVENQKGVILKPQLNGNYSFYEINKKKISSGYFVLLAFGIYPKYIGQRIERKDKNPLNNSLDNLSW